MLMSRFGWQNISCGPFGCIILVPYIYFGYSTPRCTKALSLAAMYACI